MLSKIPHLSLWSLSIFVLLIACASPEEKSEAVARKYCSSCHLFPDPKMLDKETWEKQVLPEMAFRMGRDYQRLWTMSQEDIAAVSNVIPQSATVSDEEWKQIMSYYQKNAPEKIELPPLRETKNLQQFIAEEYNLPSPFPAVTHISFDSVSKSLFVGTRQSMLLKLNDKLELQSSELLPSPVSYIDQSSTPWVMTCMGIMDPNDQSKGELQTLGVGLEHQTFITGLKRPVHVASADFNNDHRTDYLVSEFGNYTGKLTLYEQQEKGFIGHPIHYLPGTRRTLLTDYDKDGVIDILALVTQGDEQIVLYRGHGKFNFSPEILLQFPPMYGSSYFDLVDFNADGHMDILYTNGDNADYSQVLKPYHGIRIYLSNGKGKFAEHVFLPMHGASMAIAKDFDHDRDVDIAAVSFFPDFKTSPSHGFLYFENTGEGFSAHATPVAANARWLTISSADIDHDKDEDLIIGALNFSPGIPQDLISMWQKKNTSLLVLRNQLY